MSSSPAQSHKYTPFDTVLDHVARHELDAALEVFGKLLLRPVQVPDESLEGVQLPEEVLRCPGAITAIDPNTHTQVRRQMSTCYLGGGIKGLEGVGVVVAGAEVDAVPLHFFFFTQFCSGHILTGPPTCLLSCLFRSFWTVSLWAKKEREGFTVTDQ